MGIRAAVLAVAILATGGMCVAQDQPAAGKTTSQVARVVGVVKSSQPGSLTMTSDTGGEVTVTLTATTKLLRVEPGQTDLKNATPIQASDIQPGDRILVRAPSANDPHSMTALAVIVMKQADVSSKQQHDREDWQKRGESGLVTAVSAPNVTISTGGLSASRSITVTTTPATVVRRYSEGSVKYDDAKPSSLDQVKVGDQLRAKGERSADGTQLTAEEIVYGSFRNIAGPVTAVDSASGTLTVQDGIEKTAVIVKVSASSQIKKLPPEMAQRIAMRLKAAGAGSGDKPAQPAPANQASSPERPSGPPDFQRFLNRIPNSQLADLQKGDVVMIVSTPGDGMNPVTAITLLVGVEPILSAAPSRAASMLLSAWTLGTPGGGGGEGDVGP